MRRLIKNISLFSIPFVVMSVVVIIIDPFNYFKFYLIIDLNTKKQLVYKLNYALWKLIEYDADRNPCVVLGDSRMNRLDFDEIQRITGKTYYNFSFGAGTLPEICDNFWFAANRANLESVVLGISFNLYNLYNSSNRVDRALEVMQNPHLYLVNREVWKGIFRILEYQIKKEIPDIEKPRMAKEKFWIYQLDEPTRRYYARYARPMKMIDELKRISSYCHERNIELRIVVLPNHIDLQKKVKEYGLSDEYERFLEDLIKLGPVYYFDFPNIFTGNDDNYTDPFHFKPERGTAIVRQIWETEPLWIQIWNDPDRALGLVDP